MRLYTFNTMLFSISKLFKTVIKFQFVSWTHKKKRILELDVTVIGYMYYIDCKEGKKGRKKNINIFTVFKVKSMEIHSFN